MTASEQVLDEIKRMSVADLADLVRALEREITGRDDRAAAGVAAMSPGAGISLRDLVTDRIPVIRAVRDITDLGLQEARVATDVDEGDQEDGLAGAGQPARPKSPPPPGESSERIEVPARLPRAE